jgi:hypothetical protein
MVSDTHSHYLVGYYTTHQPDGVHIEAHCTWREKLEGVRQDESAGMSAFDCWAALLLHGYKPIRE